MMLSTGLSHLGCIVNTAFFKPKSILASCRSALGPETILSLPQTGTLCTRNRVQPIEGQSWPRPKKGSSSRHSYDWIILKGMHLSKEKTKFPLLHGWMLQCTALSNIGFATTLAILVWTSHTMALAARDRMCVSVCGSLYPPVWSTVTSVMVGVTLFCLCVA